MIWASRIGIIQPLILRTIIILMNDNYEILIDIILY